MIVSVTVINSYGEKIKMVLDDPEDSGYAITSISGIEPVQVDIKQTQLVSGLKYKYNFGFYKNRDIGFNIIYSEWGPDGLKSIEKRRDNLYKYFKTNDKIQIIFERGRRDGTSGTQLFYIEGYVYKHAPTFFSQQCGAVISVTCPDPWFKECWWTDQTETELSFTTVVQSSGPSLTINYEGDIFTGFKITTDNTVNDYSGNTITLLSIHNSISRRLDINIPVSYDLNGKLKVDLQSDIISVSTIEEITSLSDEYYLATIKNSDGVEGVIILDYWDHFTFLSATRDSHTTSRNIGLTVDEQDTKVLKYGTIYEGTRVVELPLFIVTNYGGEDCDNEMTNELEILHGHQHRPDHDYDQIVLIGQLSNGYAYLNDSSIPVDKIYYTQEFSDNADHNDIGFVPCKKILSQSDTPVNHIGWVDSSSISKRQELPILNPGSNQIYIMVDNQIPQSYDRRSFKIEYNTLYRGL